MSDDYVKMMRERVEALEAAYGPFGTHNETHNHVNKRLEKLEAADKDRGERQLYWEKHLSVELRNMNDLINESKLLPLFSHREQLGELKTRIEALEEKCGTTLELMERLEELEHWHEDHEVERLRQDRWHACRDAVLPAIAATAVDHGMTDAECVHDAARFADAAHGPLEAKAPVVETYNMTAAYVAEVNALVEAARKHVHEERDTQYAMPTDELEAALKPFEAVKGGL